MPFNMPAAPQRAAFKSAKFSTFRSFSDTATYTRHIQPSQPVQRTQPESAAQTSQKTPLSARVEGTSLMNSEWENERMQELSTEIHKLLENPLAASSLIQHARTNSTDTSRPATTVTDDKACAPNSKGSHRRAPSMPESASVLEGLSIGQPLNLYKVPDGIMQVFVMGIHPSNPINRPYVVVRLGDQVFQTSVSKAPTGNWNEGFELIVSYHMQLFGTVHLDVYSSNTLLPDTHVGRAEIKISLLDGFPEIFTSYYEIWDKKLAASTVPEQRQRQVVSKNLGALQVRINYRYQKLEDPEPKIAKTRGVHIAGTVPNQLVNQIASNQAGSAVSTDMPIEELVAGFANEYNKYMEMARKQGRQAFVRKATATAADGSKPDTAFAKVDDDTAPPDITSGPEGQAQLSANESTASGGWFADMFAGLSPSGVASGASSDSEAVKASVSTAQPNKTEQKESGQPAGDKTIMQSLTSIFISPSLFMVMKSLDRLIGAFNQGVELSNTELLGGLMTLYKFHNEADLLGVTKPHKGELVNGVERLKVPGHYARFALATYGWRALYFFNRGITLMDGAKIDSDVTSVLQYLNMAPENLLGYEFRSSQLFCPSYFVAHDRQHDAVVLAVRGTMSAEDTVVDLSCEYTKWNGGLVHSGMQASAHWLFVKVMPQMLAYAKSQGLKKIRIVGHSLGASMAAILMIMVQTARTRLDGLGVEIGKYDIKAYCFGPAPCVSDNIADRFRDCIETYVNKDDVVPRLCYGSVSDFKRMSISAADEADGLAQRLYAPFEDTVLQQQRWKDKFSRLTSIREDILATQENLHLALPGTIYHIVSYKSKSNKDKKAPKDPSLEVAFGKRELFGASLPNDPGQVAERSGGASALNSSDAQDPEEQQPQNQNPPPPPTPVTKVRSESVSPEDLADAINTPIRDEEAITTEQQARQDEKAGAKPIPGAGMIPTASGDKFYPVWVQRVPNNSFREIILRPTILTDHMPSAYELAFTHAIETQMHERRLLEKRRKAGSGTNSNSTTHPS
ncbi:hypothetical protein BX070DRAFT_226286 [Coemansia spiralis]|nr:hypothetical protein BX070DRAFT_226286 [Coemansia spiralis]